MKFRITTLKEADIDILSEIRALMNLSLKFDFITDHMLVRCVVEDPNFIQENTLLAYNNGKLVGVLIGAERVRAPIEAVRSQKDIGWIKAVAVHPTFLKEGLLEVLLTEFESLMRDKNKRCIRLADFASWHFFPGINVAYDFYINTLMDLNFVKDHEAVNYEVSLLNFDIPQRIVRYEKSLKKEGIVFRKANSNEMNVISRWVKHTFSPFWAYEVERAFEFKQPKIWIAERSDGEILGFSVYGSLEPEWFGPIGVDPKARAKGIGSVLLFKSLYDMRLEGLRIAIIPWTSHLFFYAQIPNIVGIRHYWIMVKKLN